ncbi:MAG: enoyl-ACP reductase FabV [Spirochaetia bacterium]
MIVKPMVRNNICMNAHPVGCKEFVRRQIEYVKAQPKVDGPKRVLIIGSSGGYGLATRIAFGFGSDADTIGISYERGPVGKRTGTVGWYSTHAFDGFAEEAGRKSISLYGDAFSHEMKAATVKQLKAELGQVDLVVYSLASGVRTDPDTQEQYRSALKPLANSFVSKSIDPLNSEITTVKIEPATKDEVESTVRVMGGDDWEIWINKLIEAEALAPGAQTIAYSYIGPELTKPVYREGTIGAAKDHLEATAYTLDTRLKEAVGGSAYVSVNKAVVSRASAVIPVVPLYFALLFKVMQEKGLHEECIEQMYRLLADRLCAGEEIPLDEQGRIRLDDWEMREDVQKEVTRRWDLVTSDNVDELADTTGYKKSFLNIHGFGFDNVDYDADVEI